MISYERDFHTIAFLLDKNVSSAIAAWNREVLQLTSQHLQYKPYMAYRVTLLKRLEGEIAIEVEQLYPHSAEGDRFKQVFAAQQTHGTLSLIKFNSVGPVWHCLDHEQAFI